MRLNLPLTLTAALFVLTALAGQSRALPPLKENDRVMGELVAGEVGYQIQKFCPSIKPRMLRAVGRLQQQRRLELWRPSFKLWS